jgi:acyl-CoA reductase-like NAD-dependent aldehyde dehydrogenase
MHSIKVESPFDGRLLEEIAVSTEADIDVALDRARKVYENQEMWLPQFQHLTIR